MSQAQEDTVPATNPDQQAQAKPSHFFENEDMEYEVIFQTAQQQEEGEDEEEDEGGDEENDDSSSELNQGEMGEQDSPKNQPPSPEQGETQEKSWANGDDDSLSQGEMGEQGSPQNPEQKETQEEKWANEGDDDDNDSSSELNEGEMGEHDNQSEQEEEWPKEGDADDSGSEQLKQDDQHSNQNSPCSTEQQESPEKLTATMERFDYKLNTLQESTKDIQENTETIQDSTEDIQENTETIQDSTEDIQENTETIQASTDDGKEKAINRSTDTEASSLLSFLLLTGSFMIISLLIVYWKSDHHHVELDPVKPGQRMGYGVVINFLHVFLKWCGGQAGTL